MRLRIRGVLHAAAATGRPHLVLGAWGCAQRRGRDLPSLTGVAGRGEIREVKSSVASALSMGLHSGPTLSGFEEGRPPEPFWPRGTFAKLEV